MNHLSMCLCPFYFLDIKLSSNIFFPHTVVLVFIVSFLKISHFYIKKHMKVKREQKTEFLSHEFSIFYRTLKIERKTFLPKDFPFSFYWTRIVENFDLLGNSPFCFCFHSQRKHQVKEILIFPNSDVWMEIKIIFIFT